MRVAIYIENNIQQVILTPESEFETHTIKSMQDGYHEVSFKEGTFDECRGGYIRHFNDNSLMVVITKSKEQPTQDVLK